MSLRFDSLDARRENRSFTFSEKLGEATAWRMEDVIPALARVAEAVAEGSYAAGFVAYEAGPAFDEALAAHPPLPGIPLVWFELYGRRLEVEPISVLEDAESYELGTLTGSANSGEYERAVRTIQDLIAAGDSYQVNLTLRLQGSFRGSPLALYRNFVRAQRSAFCAYLPLGNHTIVSASPELFFRYSGREIELRPMKGTRPRGRWSEEDEAFAAALAASPKDRAENLMIVDLLRNDLGRISEFGSVRVPRLFEVERYPTVHQLTSTIRGTMRSGVGVVEIFRALFPSGSVTGAPKVRTSEIIHSLEGSPRGPYTGAIGFLGPDDGVFSVAIRTGLIDHTEATIQVGVGSGITSDSDPGAEYRETISKGHFVRHHPGTFSLIESLRLEIPGGYTLVEQHLERLAKSARYFDFPFAPPVARASLLELADALEEGVYKIRLLLRSSGAHVIEHQRIPAEAPEARIAISTLAVESADPFLYHKTTRRRFYDDALRAAGEGVDDVILINERGEVTESTNSNLVLMVDGELVTPPLDSGILPGVLRGEEIRVGRIRERVVRPEDLRSSPEIYLLNSVRGWRRAFLVR